MGFPGGASSKKKNTPANAGDIRDASSIPVSGKIPWRRHGNPLQYFCLENSMDRGAWQATVHRVAESDMTEQLTHTLWFEAKKDQETQLIQELHSQMDEMLVYKIPVEVCLSYILPERMKVKKAQCSE